MCCDVGMNKVHREKIVKKKGWLSQLGSIFISCCCSDKLLQTSWLKNNTNLFSCRSRGQTFIISIMVLKSKCWQGWIFLRAPGGQFIPWPLLSSRGCHLPCLVATSLRSLVPSPLCLLLLWSPASSYKELHNYTGNIQKTRIIISSCQVLNLITPASPFGL